MTQSDDIKDLKAEVKVLREFRTEVKVRCALAWFAITSFLGAVVGIITFYSDVVKDAAKAALKVIILRIMS